MRDKSRAPFVQAVSIGNGGTHFNTIYECSSVCCEYCSGWVGSNKRRILSFNNNGDENNEREWMITTHEMVDYLASCLPDLPDTGFRGFLQLLHANTKR
jgi:hypothetical protein